MLRKIFLELIDFLPFFVNVQKNKPYIRKYKLSDIFCQGLKKWTDIQQNKPRSHPESGKIDFNGYKLACLLHD